MPLRKAKQPVIRIVHLPLSTMPKSEPSNFIDTQTKTEKNIKSIQTQEIILEKKKCLVSENIYINKKKLMIWIIEENLLGVVEGTKGRHSEGLLKWVNANVRIWWGCQLECNSDKGLLGFLIYFVSDTVLVGLFVTDYHVFHYSVFFIRNVERGCNVHTIKSNWRVNCAT